jgi:hypothetical protein
MICTTFKQCSKEVQNWINKQNNVNEESLSDWFLYKLSDLEPRIQYLEFNRFQEAQKTGADYELWIVNPKTSLRFRIQAKRLRKGHDHYSSIAYTNKHGLQIDKLISDAKSLNYIPLYSFYNEEQKISRCRKKINDEGVYLSFANELYNEILLKPKKNINTDFLISKSFPISCWFCCPLISKGTKVGIINFFNHYYNYNSKKNIVVDNQGQYSELPLEIFDLIELLRKKENFYWKQENLKEYQNIKGIIIIDLRDENKRH